MLQSCIERNTPEYTEEWTTYCQYCDPQTKELMKRRIRNEVLSDI
ncbi:unnamed protein product [Nezara viridula]|uniref:Uncharacterized protein n=1 Tax=Nezara viridula TaxID=85310 RepID=A0A9P0E6G3_NEZVI|nr:unnamed protein product [Nezara viridula]